MNDNLFKRIEEKTKVNKDTIISLARKLQNGNYKDEKILREIIHELSSITGKDVSEEKEEKITDLKQAIIDSKELFIEIEQEIEKFKSEVENTIARLS